MLGQAVLQPVLAATTEWPQAPLGATDKLSLVFPYQLAD
jgi:hypothetical protein